MFSTSMYISERTLYPNSIITGSTLVENIKEFKDRLSRLIQEKEKSVADFCRKVKAPNNSVHSYLNEGREPKITFLSKVKKAYPDVNLTWLLIGTGDMYENIDMKFYIDELNKELNVVREKEELYKRIIQEKDKNEALQKGNEPS